MTIWKAIRRWLLTIYASERRLLRRDREALCRRFTSMWAWGFTNWGPITAICAVIVSAGSTYYAYKAYGLSEDIQREASRTALLGRMPVVMVHGDVSESSISLNNIGVGAADVYRVSLSYKGRVVTFLSYSGGAVEEMIKLRSFVSFMIRDNVQSRRLIDFTANLPSRFIKADDTIDIFRLKEKDTAEFPALANMFNHINVSVCYMDLSGEFLSSSSFRNDNLAVSEECAIRPAAFVPQ